MDSSLTDCQVCQMSALTQMLKTTAVLNEMRKLQFFPRTGHDVEIQLYTVPVSVVEICAYALDTAAMTR